jgi:hypothetical protein
MVPIKNSVHTSVKKNLMVRNFFPSHDTLSEKTRTMLVHVINTTIILIYAKEFLLFLFLENANIDIVIKMIQYFVKF